VWLKTDRSLGLSLSLSLSSSRATPTRGTRRFEDHDEQRATPRRRRGRATARWTAPRRWRPPGWASRQGTPRLGCPRSWSCLVKRPRARRCRSSLQAARGLARLSQPAYAATGTATSGRPWTTERITKRRGKSVPKGAIVRKILTLGSTACATEGSVAWHPGPGRARSEQWRSQHDPPNECRRPEPEATRGSSSELVCCQWPPPVQPDGRRPRT
jgi:hypothetical protein